MKINIRGGSIVLLLIVAIAAPQAIQSIIQRTVGENNNKNLITNNFELDKSYNRYFEKNIGQYDSNIEYYAQFSKEVGIAFIPSSINFFTDQGEFQLEFLNSNYVKPLGVEKAAQYVNYFYGEAEYGSIPLFYDIVYINLYDGIDLRYYWNESGFKYEFVVDANINPSQIQMQYLNIDDLIVSDNKIEIIKSTFRFQDEKLEVFYADSGKQIEASFISGTQSISSISAVGFQIDKNYDSSQKIIIDPYMISYSTFVGGGSFDDPYQMQVDEDGFAYVVGFADPPSGNLFPSTDGSFRTDRAGSDIILFKLSADGSELIFSTYIGGVATDVGTSIFIDEKKDIYLTGYTNSIDFPITDSAYNTSKGLSTDAFIMKISADGSTLLYSTFLGGNGNEKGLDIVLDNQKNAIITGYTTSNNFPVSNNSTFSGGDTFGFGDSFITKISSNGSEIIYSYYLGGSEDDYAGSIALDSIGNIVISGGTFSSDFPVTDLAFDTTYNGDETWTENRNQAIYGGDAFISKLYENGSFIFSTFVGGDGWDYAGFGLKLDLDDNIYVGGSTESVNFPTKNAYMTTFSGHGSAAYFQKDDGFLLKVKPDGSDLIFSTYLGGSSGDDIIDIALGTNGDIFVTGMTASDDFPTTADANFPIYSGSTDIFVSLISGDGSDLLYSTFLGGKAIEWVNGMHVDGDNSIYLAGTSNSAGFPITCDAYSTSKNLNHDFVILKLIVSDTVDNSNVCNPQTPSSTEDTTFAINFPIFIVLTLLVKHSTKRRK